MLPNPAATPCIICGSMIPPRQGGPGRPRLYCTDQCALVNKLISRLETALVHLGDHLERLPTGRQYASRIASKLFSMANTFGNRLGGRERARNPGCDCHGSPAPPGAALHRAGGSAPGRKRGPLI